MTEQEAKEQAIVESGENGAEYSFRRISYDNWEIQEGLIFDRFAEAIRQAEREKLKTELVTRFAQKIGNRSMTHVVDLIKNHAAIEGGDGSK